MATDGPSASWHPAMMPNSNSTSLAPDSHDEPSQPQQQLPADLDHTDAQTQESIADRGIADAVTDGQVKGKGSVLDHFQDDSGADAWDISGQETQPDESSNQDDSIHITDRPTEASPTSITTSKHTTTGSFARTVPHSLTFDSNDDAEWDLQRTDTEPGKFMSPSTRTNSFPPVPPLEHARESPEDLPAPAATQAEEIMRELEQEEHEHEADQLASPAESKGEVVNANSHAQADEPAFQQTIGGDMLGSAEEASEARFEEGLPLIPQGQDQRGKEAPRSKKLSFADPFADEDDGGSDDFGDDFFSQLQDGPRGQGKLDEAPGIQRKDTSMFVATTKNEPVESSYTSPQIPTIAETRDSSSKAQVEQITGPTDTARLAPKRGHKPTKSMEIAAKWAAEFADDDDFLLEATEDDESKAPQSADFLGSDDEGLLDDTEETVQPPEPADSTPNTGARISSQPATNRYRPNLPQSQSQPALNAYNSVPSQTQSPYANAIPPPTSTYGIPPPVKPELNKAQSFVDKTKGGYHSPYDLPDDVVMPPPPPRKRMSMQQLRRSSTASSVPPTEPPRSNSVQPLPPPPRSGASVSSLSPPSSSHSNHAASSLKGTPHLNSHPSFFEELPIVAKPRPASRHGPSSRPTSSHSQASYGEPPNGLPYAPPPARPPMAAPAPALPQMTSPTTAPGLTPLVAPEKASPYAQLQSNTLQKPSAPPSSRYSPAQGLAVNGAVHAASNRYSPAPPGSRPASSYSAVPPPILAHQPRTSSPLAHFEASTERRPSASKLSSPISTSEMHFNRSVPSQYEHRLNRMPSLPTTTEVDEDGAPASALRSPPMSQRSVSANVTTTSPERSKRYSPVRTRKSPPPMSPPKSGVLSPPKRAAPNYAPINYNAGPAADPNFVPPVRSHTQSPGALYGHHDGSRPTDIVPRPSSVQGMASPRSVSDSQTMTRARGMSQALNLVAPTDGRELDPLQRWRGAPVISWGVGGTIVTSFPKDVPRYGISQALPQIIRSPGGVRIKSVKDVQPLEDRLAKFPGPLKGKSKKKEALAWLTAGIEILERALPNIAFQQYVSHEDKRAVERVLLWKILRVLVEFDGVLEGNPEVDKAVRQILSPRLDDQSASTLAVGAGLAPSAVTSMQSDAVDSAAMEQIKNHLLRGERDKAAWAAVDKRLWGHALLISATVPGNLYQQVSEEFIKKEVNYHGHNNESLAALYGVLSGNYEECIDELVPSHARVGLRLMSRTNSAGDSMDEIAGLDKWQETLGLILSNRSNEDIRALTALGNLLSGYGRAEAAHICFIFARPHAVFGGLDDPNANFVLVGADHRQQADQFAKETEALLLSEMYEYGLSLFSGSNAMQSCPHLAAYKLQHAMTLAEYGYRDKAIQYCEAIMNSIGAQTKRSPYYHPVLESSVDELLRRLKLAPREETNSWIPSLGKSKTTVSNSVWNTFNKFVAGDDNDGSDKASTADGGVESGPFARVAGGTPTISRSPSLADFGPYSNNATPATVPVTRAGSRYAPVMAQPGTSPYEAGMPFAPRSSLERQSSNQRSSLDLPRPTDSAALYGSSFGSDVNSAPGFGFQPIPAPTASLQASPYSPSAQAPAPISIPTQPQHSSYEPYAVQSPSQSYGAPPPAATVSAPAPVAKPEPPSTDAHAAGGYEAPSYGYQPPSLNTAEPPSTQPEEPTTNGNGGYEAPSYQPYGFEPPSYEPGPEEDGDAEKPKKKSFMDDDEDDIPALKKPEEKSKSDKDRENEEMFRRVAEEEAKRAEAEKAAKATKKGWFGGGWFGGGAKKETAEPANKPIRANLGEASSFYYDPDLKRWINKKAGADNTPAKTATPPPPRSSSVPPLHHTNSAPPSGPPMMRPSGLKVSPSNGSLRDPGVSGLHPPPLARTASSLSNVSGVNDAASGPPSRPATSLSNASSIDDLLGPAGAGGARRGKKSKRAGRYVDVMAK